MARGAGVETDDILYGSTELRARSQMTDERLVGNSEIGVHKPIAEHELPRLRSLSRFVPVYRCRDGERETREFSRIYIGSDNQLYVLHFRDNYERRRIGRNRLVSEECAVTYQGRKISEAIKVMNDEVKKAQNKEHYLLVTQTKIGGAQVAGRNLKHPFSIKEIVDKLDQMIPEPEHDPRSRVEREFSLTA